MSRTRPPKAVRSILYIHWKLRYYPNNNPMNCLATNVTKKLDHNIRNTTGTRPSLQMMLNNSSSIVSRRMKLKVLKSNSILQNVSMTGWLKNKASLVVNPPYVRLLMTFKKNWQFQLRLICLLSMIQVMPFR